MKPLLLLLPVFSNAVLGQLKSELTVRLGDSAVIPCKFSADVGAEHVVWLKGTKFLGIAKNNLQSKYTNRHLPPRNIYAPSEKCLYTIFGFTPLIMRYDYITLEHF